jgi:hypothetical protein
MSREYRAGGVLLDCPCHAPKKLSLLARILDHVKDLWRVLFSDDDLL